MRTSTHYELNLVEGTDKVNPLVQDVPNYETIDDAMFNNKCASIGIATELRTGTVHALTRQNEDAPMFRFTASSNYTSGDTFTVDGVQVSALLVDGTPLPNMAYIIGSEVLCVLKGTLMTVFANRTTSSDSDKLGGHLPSYYATDDDLDTLEGVVDAHTEQINQIGTDLAGKLTFKNYTLTTDANGYITHSDWNEQKVISAQVFVPARSSIELWLNNVTDSTYFGYVHSRGQSNVPVANQEVRVRVWFKDY